jgi:hypothetical protein
VNAQPKKKRISIQKSLTISEKEFPKRNFRKGISEKVFDTAPIRHTAPTGHALPEKVFDTAPIGHTVKLNFCKGIRHRSYWAHREIVGPSGHAPARNRKNGGHSSYDVEL